MPSPSSADGTVAAAPPAAPSVPPVPSLSSPALAIVAAIALTAACLLSSPPHFADRPWPAGSWLRPIIETLGFHAKLPTPRGIEIRELALFLGAAVLASIAGLRLLLGRGRQQPSVPRELDLDAMARTPTTWWLVLVVAAVVSGAFSHAPAFASGGIVVRLAFLAWWWPLATVLSQAHARRLAHGLCGLLAIVAVLGLWYQRVRAVVPSGRVEYPFGNAGYLGSVLLPGAVMSTVLGVQAAVAAIRQTPRTGSACRAVFFVVAAGVTGYALVRTGSRAAQAGLAAAGLAWVFLIAGRRGRRIVGVVALAVALLGGYGLAAVATGRWSIPRAEPIRSRLVYEWDYALRLFMQKPILGHGDGGYSLLAGQLARERQFDEPTITAFHQQTWPDHAHNEYAELLADLGLIGLAAFVGALVATGVRTARFAAAGALVDGRTLATVVGLGAACAGIAVDSGFSVAMRVAGPPPVLLTVWAALWAMVRPRGVDVGRILERETAPTRSRFFSRGVGLVVIATGAWLGWLGSHDWRAARRMHDSQLAMADGRYDAAAAAADFAEAFELEPFRRCIATLKAARIRQAYVGARLAATAAPLSQDEMGLAREGWILVERLKQIAPRFLLLAGLEAESARHLAEAFRRLGQPSDIIYFRARAQTALVQNARDEPFDSAAVRDAWLARPDASVVEQARLLRGVMRAGLADGVWESLFQAWAARPDLTAAWRDVRQSAEADLGRPPREWRDALSPEAFRLAARLAARSGDAAGAAAELQRARGLYEAAAPRLPGGLAATLFEQAVLDFERSPLEATLALGHLDRCEALLEAIVNPPDWDDRVTTLRAAVLVAAGDETQAAALTSRLWAPPSDARAWLGERYVSLVRQCVQGSWPAAAPRLVDWARRGDELLAGRFDAKLALAAALAAAGERQAAQRTLLAAAEAATTDAERGDLQRVRERFPGVFETATTSPVEPSTGPAAERRS